ASRSISSSGNWARRKSAAEAVIVLSRRTGCGRGPAPRPRPVLLPPARPPCIPNLPTPNVRPIMPRRSSLLALVLAASFAPAADLRTLKGDAYNGTLVSVNDKEVVFTKAGGTDRVTVPVDQILNIELGAQVKIPANGYIDVELVDGSILHCSNVTFK